MDIKELYKLYRQHPCITTDSRDCPEGSIFLALKGETFDGNKFALQALEKGCAYAIVDAPELNATSSTANPRLIFVEDCLQTFKDLAREHRRQFDIPVIAITGTNGKTTTKELVKAVLSEKFNVLATEGNFNNDVGVPKTLFRLSPKHQIAIIEMGASHPGDIKTLVETAEPTCGLITNVGRAHLQGFGSFEGVIKTKGELYDYLRGREDGLVFLDADNDYLVDMITDEMWVTPYSTDPEKQYSCISGEVVENDTPFLKFRWRKPLMELEETGESQKWHKVQTQLVGGYNLQNLMAAIAVGINFGVERKAICHALENYRPTNNRSQFVETAHNRLIVDAYNANPTSMMAALENFSRMSGENRMLILGDMRELGADSAKEHQQLVDIIKETGIADVWLVGAEFGKTDCQFRKFADVEAVKGELQQHRPEGRLILIKGSNGTRLYQLPELL
ncbi:MAG: UDP-N-acetylmuramoyl-tripeptide--D-alanyl-D-alanine ligase [Prevotella sp.]|nr:UDP-N-acetylmuramoyl-tripeptide--D-alanyl-D-alanine ligase [Bacteroidaceae bacterium]MBR1415452.1 UDP-N-acetylmuramoyl-tripeptide--D-alanyl-D-alanine ligase [Prevotella sp.]